MSSDGFRFRPPETAVTPALAWVLARAYGPLILAAAETDGQAALGLARGLALDARIGARHAPDRLAAEVGDLAAAELKRARAMATAREILLRAALEEVDRAAADLRMSYAPLKGQALRSGGYSAPGSRPFVDVDVLVPTGHVESLQQDLVRRGFAVVGRGYEHQAPPLRHHAGGLVELHRTIPGVRLKPSRPRHSVTFDDLVEAQLLNAASGEVRSRAGGQLLLPSPELLTAHALVHELAQHGLTPGAYPSFLMVADLLDIGFRGTAGRATLATIAPWIERELSFAEAEAALDLATALADGDPTLYAAPRGRARILLDHFHAGATDPRYAEALKGRMFERPPSDRPRPLARFLLLVATLSRGTAGTRGGDTGVAGWLLRPAELVRRWRAARRKAREISPADGR